MIYAVSILIKLLISKRTFAVSKMGVNEVVDTSCNLFEDANLDLPEMKYGYLDHTADVQLHAWGSNLKEAIENVATAMFGYMTDIETVAMDVALEIIT